MYVTQREGTCLGRGPVEGGAALTDFCGVFSTGKHTWRVTFSAYGTERQTWAVGVE